MARIAGMAAGIVGCTILAVVSVWAQEGAVFDAAKFSAGHAGPALPEGWKPLTFKKIPRATRYELVQDAETVVVKATSEAAASGLTKDVTIDPKAYPIVRWRWKVENLLTRSDVSRKDGDDYPARLYITFSYDPEKVGLGRRLRYEAGRILFGDIPIAALNYIWETHTPVGTVIENAYTDFARMIVVESGPQKVGQWVEEERNLYEDYKQAFGGEPPLINGVAIMTDTDNTGERAVAYYGDIRFEKKPR